jgi:hypothetical protein
LGSSSKKAKPRRPPASKPKSSRSHASRPSSPSKTKTKPKTVAKPAPSAAAPAKPPTAPAPAAEAPPRGDSRRHVLSLAFLRDGDEFLARLETDGGEITELKNRALDQLLMLVAGELEDLL